MIRKYIKPKLIVLISSIGGIVFLLVFLCSNFYGYLLYRDALSISKPTVRSEEIKYYRKIFSVLSQASALSKDNAEYLTKKADFMVEAMDLATDLSFDRKDIENLYIKAINLNPTNFNYHLKLGWFYLYHNNTKAEDELRKTVELYPSYFKVYVYLSKYYLKTKKADLAFSNLLSAFYFSNINAVYDIRSEIKGFDNLFLEGKKKDPTLVIYPQRSEVALKDYNFPHVDISLNVRVFIKKVPFATIKIYSDDYAFAPFKFVETTEDLDLYQLNLEPAKLNSFLDNLTIKVNPSYPIEKIEFTLKL